MQDSSINIGHLTVKGRLVMPPMATSSATDDGKVTDKTLEFYKTRSANPNISLIITEHCYIAEEGKAKPAQLSISSNKDIEGLQRITDIIHLNDKKTFAQINYAPKTDICSLSSEEIKKIVRLFADASRRAKASGYDGVEIHSAHGYLLNQFYTPLKNHRNDGYGGSLDLRMRIHKEVLYAVRSAVGQDLPISVRLGGCDYVEGGSTIEDASYAAKILEDAGADMISVSGGLCRYTRPGHDEPGYFAEVSKAIKAAVSIPVMLTGGVKTKDEAEKLLLGGAADLIGIGRVLLNDPEWES